MREIAERVGVNKSTVSRVLSGRDGTPASPETAKAIRRVARELGYNVDPWAASLRTNRTRAIGVLVPRMSDTALAIVFEAIEAEAARCGYEILVATTGDDPVEQRHRIELLRGRRVDGLIIMTAHVGEEDYFDDLKRDGLKFVLAYRGVGEHPVVRGDDLGGGHHVTRHLLSKGHRRIGVIAGPAYAPGAAQRVDGYRAALGEAGVRVDPELIVESGRGIDDGERVARQLLKLPSPPTAIFAVTDLLAIGAMSAIQEAGLRVGNDIAVVGYNDIPLAARLPVPLTSVQTPADDIGRLTVQGLLHVLEGEQPQTVILPVRVHVRASSDPEARSRPGGAL